MNRRTIASLMLAFLLPHAHVRAQTGAVRGTLTVPNPGIAGIVVYLVPTVTSAVPAVSPLAAEMDQRDLRFVPRVIAVTPGSTVSFSNSDPVLHNVFHPLQRAGGFDLGTWPQGERRTFTFDEEGAFVIFCHVHPEMVAYVVVVASRYHAVTDENGRFRLDGVTPGTYRLRTWHRRLRTHDQLVSVVANGVARVDLSLQYGFPIEPRAAERPVPR
jgi:plastocyanin